MNPSGGARALFSAVGEVLPAITAAEAAERERVRALMMEMHERDKHRHNYWRCAVVEIFGA